MPEKSRKNSTGISKYKDEHMTFFFSTLNIPSRKC